MAGEEVKAVALSSPPPEVMLQAAEVATVKEAPAKTIGEGLADWQIVILSPASTVGAGLRVMTI